MRRPDLGALVEAGFRLGDRFLYLHAPMFRGDDVADLQQRLSALGFDTGRVDGIFGRLTSSALADFQRNVSLPVDGILGASTFRELKRVMPRHAEPQLVSDVRDRERLRQAPRTLLGRRLAIGEEGGLDAWYGRPSSSGGHRSRGHPPDPSRWLAPGGGGQRRRGRGLRGSPARPRWPPLFGVVLQRVQLRVGRGAAAGRAPAVAGGRRPRDSRGRVQGMSLPILRETRMPAVSVRSDPRRSWWPGPDIWPRPSSKPSPSGRHPCRLNGLRRSLGPTGPSFWPQHLQVEVTSPESIIHSLMHRLWMTLDVPSSVRSPLSVVMICPC